MSTLERRVKRLEDRGGHTAQLRAMTDEQLKRIVLEHLIAATPEEIETDLVEHPEFRELYEELLPQAREQREAVEALAKRFDGSRG
jgi:hypothetical protein